MNKFDRLRQSTRLEQIRDAIDRITASPDRVLKHWFYCEAERLKRDMASEWSRLNGLKADRRHFSLSALIPGRKTGHTEHIKWDVGSLDHPEFFKAQQGRWRAIVAHLYGADAAERARKFAAQHGLVAHIPPNPTASWYYPGECTMIVYTPPGVSIEWLSEQMQVEGNEAGVSEMATF